MRLPTTRRVRGWLFDVLERDVGRRAGARAVGIVLTATIVLSTAGVALDTVDRIAAEWGGALAAVEAFSLTVFALEYLARLWVADLHLAYRGQPAWRVRLAVACRPLMLIDLLVVLSGGLAWLLGPDWHVLRMLRMVRLFKLARRSPALAVLLRVVRNERRGLMGAGLVLAVAVVLSASLLYLLERTAQPDAFGSVPQAMWWSVVTLTTLGYGDVVPVTVAGRIVGGLVVVVGLGLFALPVAILAAGFQHELPRRDFVVTWGMVARVPLFRELDAAAIATIAEALVAREVRAGEVVIRRGEPVDGMFFIAEGEVTVRTRFGPVVLGEGEYFGEVGLVFDQPRNATVVAERPCRLLMLERHAFRELIDDNPGLAREIHRVAVERRERHEGMPLDVPPPPAGQPEYGDGDNGRGS